MNVHGADVLVRKGMRVRFVPDDLAARRVKEAVAACGEDRMGSLETGQVAAECLGFDEEEVRARSHLKSSG